MWRRLLRHLVGARSKVWREGSNCGHKSPKSKAAGERRRRGRAGVREGPFSAKNGPKSGQNPAKGEKSAPD